jgi:carboxymethylenebutenolidase
MSPLFRSNLGVLARWLRIGLLSIVVLLLAGGAIVYVLSERLLSRIYIEPRIDILVPSDSESIKEGHRLARIRGCSGGCHGTEIEGGVFIDNLLLARLVAPNLTLAVRRYSNADLARIIRRGVRPDGSSVIGMPSEMFSGLTDADLGRMLAYLRSVPPHPGPAPERRLGPVARIAFLGSKLQPAAVLVRRAGLLSNTWPSNGDPTASGAYLARTSCTECHGLDLNGNPAPDLRIVAGYSSEAFAGLLRRGQALGNRELPLMSTVARQRFSHFTDRELHDLYTFLSARAANPGSSVAAPSLSVGQVPSRPDTLVIRSGPLVLRALLWRPPGRGPFPAVLFNHGSYRPADAARWIEAAVLGPVFAAHGYVFLVPFRRGVGLSADQGPADGDLMAQAFAEGGQRARNRVQLQLMEGEELNETAAALARLRTVPEVDPRRVAVVGHSFGGSLTIFLGARDTTVRAIVVFGGAAFSWGQSPELRARLVAAVRHAPPAFFVHAANDYSTAPGSALSAEMRRLGRPQRLKIYPAAGRTAREGHNFVFGNVAVWEPDVFAFLESELRHLTERHVVPSTNLRNRAFPRSGSNAGSILSHAGER